LEGKEEGGLLEERNWSLVLDTQKKKTRWAGKKTTDGKVLKGRRATDWGQATKKGEGGKSWPDQKAKGVN